MDKSHSNKKFTLRNIREKGREFYDMFIVSLDMERIKRQTA
jgi:hypothetical protein